MTMPDHYIIHAVKAQISDEVTEKVHARIREDVRTLKIFGRTAALVAAVIVTLGLTFHKAIIEAIVNYGSGELEERLKTQHAELLGAFAQTRSHSDAMREVSKSEQAQFLATMLGHRDAVTTLEFEYNKRKAELDDLIQAGREAGNTTRERIAEAQTQALSQIDLKYADLITTLDALKKAIIADAQRGPGATSASAAAQVATTPVSTERRPTVYFQFAGFKRSDAEAISKALQTRGMWSIPGEERTSAAVGVNEIRHHRDDTKAAQRLEADANQILQPYKIQVVARQNRVAKAGFLELWIYQP